VKATLEKQVAATPDDPAALSRLAAIYQRDGTTDKAISTYESALKVNSRNVPAMVQLSQLYASQPGGSEKALALAKEAYKQAPSAPGVARILGHLDLLSGDYKFALNLLAEADRQKPGDPELLYDLAQAAYFEGRVADAQNYLGNALQAGAGFAHAADAKKFLDLITLSLDPQRAVAASATVDQALKNDPNNLPALMAMGAIDEQKPDPGAAIQIYEKALDRYSDFSPAMRRLTILYADQPEGDSKKASDMGIKAYLAYPEDGDLARATGIILYRQGQYAKSAQRLKDVAVKKNSDSLVLFYLGMDQYQLKQRADSKKNLQRAVELKLPEKQAAEARRALAELK
jgi:tetratricopeptide (TPR) repeat protein